MPVSYSGTAITWPDNSTTTSGWTGFKNRIINGAMMIDQRNAGASVTPASGDYMLDRWRYASSQASKFTVQQNAGSVTPPAGYKNYLGMTVASAVTIGSTDYFELQQRIEGLNVADLGWGTANAATVTLSFWVRSSLTGTFGGTIKNNPATRSYPFTYTISAANTWEQKSVTIPGDTSGTWLTTNGIGLFLTFGLGVGSTYSGTAGSWAATEYDSATGAVSVVGTAGATWYITGVQLERGSTASSFEYRPYGTELALCQRYYEVVFSDNAGETGFSSAWNGSQRWIWHMKVQKRASATFALVGNGNWQVVTPSVNGGISSVGAYHVNTAYYLQSTANTIAGSASAEL
jgi:hypothetical protein